MRPTAKKAWPSRRIIIESFTFGCSWPVRGPLKMPAPVSRKKLHRPKGGTAS
jgi:hypothetical protein